MRLRRDVGVRETPAGAGLLKLSEGTVLDITGQVSEQLYYHASPRDTLLEPYLAIRLPDGRRGWVYADPTDFELSDTAVAEWQWANRLQALLDEPERRIYRGVLSGWREADRPGELLLTYQATRRLRDRLQRALRNYPLLPTRQYDRLLPGAPAYRTATVPGWWIDYNEWAARAERVAGGEAETALFRFYRDRVYPPDGIEYHAAAWEFPVTAREKHSLLGRGIHVGLLRALQDLVREHSFLATECNELKKRLLADVCTAGVTYWEDWPALETELDSILNIEWTLLDAADLARLRVRKEELAAPPMQALYVGKRNY